MRFCREPRSVARRGAGLCPGRIGSTPYDRKVSLWTAAVDVQNDLTLLKYRLSTGPKDIRVVDGV